MSKVCEICGKHPVAGRSISHSHRVTNRVFRPNVQKITIKDKNGRVRRANVCTRCMKAGKVERARFRRPTAGGKVDAAKGSRPESAPFHACPRAPKYARPHDGASSGREPFSLTHCANR